MSENLSEAQLDEIDLEVAKALGIATDPDGDGNYLITLGRSYHPMKNFKPTRAWSNCGPLIRKMMQYTNAPFTMTDDGPLDFNIIGADGQVLGSGDVPHVAISRAAIAVFSNIDIMDTDYED